MIGTEVDEVSAEHARSCIYRNNLENLIKGKINSKNFLFLISLHSYSNQEKFVNTLIVLYFYFKMFNSC